MKRKIALDDGHGAKMRYRVGETKATRCVQER